MMKTRVSNGLVALGICGLAALAYSFPYFYLQSKSDSPHDRRQFSKINSLKRFVPEREQLQTQTPSANNSKEVRRAIWLPPR